MLQIARWRWLGLLSALGCSSASSPVPQPQADAPEGARLARSELARETADAPEPDVTQLGGDNRAFTFDLYAELRQPGENLFFSPYSISVALVMTYAGARENTAREIASALHFTLPDERLHAAFNTLDRTLQGREGDVAQGDTSAAGLRLNAVNAHFVQQGLKLQQPFLDVLASQYDTGAYELDFMSDPEGSRIAINDWVGQKTEQRIDDLLPPKAITSRVRLVLVNAIYFKGSWRNKFNPEHTKAAPFHAPDGDLTVQMMTGRGERYGRGVDFQVATVPYASHGVHAVFVLPEDGSFEAVESRLSVELFDEAWGALERTSVTVQLPRFQFETEYKLREPLKALGMHDAFSSAAADFTPAFGRRGIFLGDVYHDGFVAMDEQGTEAAAATAVVFTSKGSQRSEVFTADRPFLFFIYDEPTGQILFAGRVLKP